MSKIVQKYNNPVAKNNEFYYSPLSIVVNLLYCYHPKNMESTVEYWKNGVIRYELANSIDEAGRRRSRQITLSVVEQMCEKWNVLFLRFQEGTSS